MTHKELRTIELREDPDEMVVWNQERPIAYLNRGDASGAEFEELQSLIAAAPEMLEALENVRWWLLEYEKAPPNSAVISEIDEALRKVKGE